MIFISEYPFRSSSVHEAIHQHTGRTAENQTQGEFISLPAPKYDSDISVEEALTNRRSVRTYTKEALTLSEISQVLWAAQGITKKEKAPPAFWEEREWPGGLRTAPSAGALYPLKIYLCVSMVENLDSGLYLYQPGEHTIKLIMKGDLRNEISNAALGQACIQSAPASVVIAAIYERTAVKYGDRAERYVHIETGHVGQNIYLQAVSLNLGTVMVGAFRDENVKSVLDLPQSEQPLAIMPLGKI